MKKITLSGVIGWDITASQLNEQLASAGGEAVELVISSPGGLVGEALEMFNALRNYQGHTTAILSGYVMSAASYLLMACNARVAEDNAVVMIHNAQGGVMGDHREVAKYGAYLQGLTEMLARAYAKITGKTMADLRGLMNDETFYFGEQIVKNGFAERLIEAQDQEADSTAAEFMARAAMESMAAKMATDSARVTADMNRAMAMVRALPTPKTGETTMDLKTLKEKHPELVAAIADETKESMAAVVDQARAEGQSKGSELERQRIAGVRAQAIPGHEQLIETMAFDGKSTAADAALAIVGAEKTLRQQAEQRLKDEANQVVPPPGDQDLAAPQTISRAQFNALPIAEQRQYSQGGGKIKD